MPVPPTFTPAPDGPVPAQRLAPGQDQERRDSLPVSGAFAVSPFQYTPQTPLPALHEEPPAAIDPDLHQRLRRLRKRPGFKVLNNSRLLLQTVQLDMDCPEPWPVYARRRLAEQLQAIAGRPLNPDELYLDLRNQQPWVDDHDREHYSLTARLTDLAVASGDAQQLAGLRQAVPADDRPLAELPQLSASALLGKVIDNPWSRDYQLRLDTFWQDHAGTWCELARLSLLDGLNRDFARKAISRDGYHLALDALGYRHFPASEQALQGRVAAQASDMRLLYLHGEAVPGLFQVRSLTTSHCFIHLPGSGRPAIEYISDNPAEMTRRLLDALNDSPAHRQWLYQQPATPGHVESGLLSGDLFQLWQRASQQEAQDRSRPPGDGFMFRLIRHALNLASAVDLWQQRPALLRQLPAPLKIAADLMRRWLLEQHNLDLAPQQVFVVYRHGQGSAPLGHVRHAGSHIKVPNDQPLNLAQALVSRYQVEHPSGYIDPGGRSVLYQDPTGKGIWRAANELPVSAEQLAAQIAGTDFLAIMTRHLEAFWDGQQQPIEGALRASLINQALLCLKHGQLQRGGFDALVDALGTAAHHWHVPGFAVQSTFIDGLEQQPCASLLLLAPPDRPLRVLYQAGLPRAFVEFPDAATLHQYLCRAMADTSWREAVLQYVPGRHRSRLGYLFSFWAGGQPPGSPVSLLRPWSEALYQPDRHKTPAQSLYLQPVPSGQPFGFIRQILKANALEEVRQLVVTPAQRALRYWSGYLRHLQWLLLPMSVLLTPGAMAALAVELGVLALDMAATRLPGHRAREKQQALLALLSLGFWGLSPATTRLLGSLQRLGRASKAVPRSRPSLGTAWSMPKPRPARMMSPRQTRLVPFFHTGALLKRWTVPGHGLYNALPVHAWKLGRKFLLWTSDRGQARTLVVSSHGDYLPWSKTVKIPNGTEIRTYAPHGFELVDPGLHRVVGQRVSAFAISTTAGNTPVLPRLSMPAYLLTDKKLAGTTHPGYLKNYRLSKFQSPALESYTDVSHIVRNSHLSPYSNPLPSTPMDVLTIRNRFGSAAPDLEELFNTLATQGIHYERIFLVHCRCAAIDSLLGRTRVYKVPAGAPQRPVSP